VIAAVQQGKRKLAQPSDEAVAGLKSRPGEGPPRAGNPHTVRNHVLNQMSAAEFDLLRGGLELAKFERGQLVQQVDAPIQHVYFIERGLVSLLARSATDLPVEIATIDSAGMVGIEVMVDAARAIHRALVQTPATSALRIKVDDFRAAIERQPSLRRHCAHVSQDLMRRSAQNLLCNTRHGLEPRLAKWLALAGGPSAGGVVPVTHESLALALGVRRPSISAALAALEMDGVVVKQRGALRLPDLPALSARACSCLPVMMRARDARPPRSGEPHRLAIAS
jgi:CRP-like cAMP-binding protein